MKRSMRRLRLELAWAGETKADLIKKMNISTSTAHNYLNRNKQPTKYIARSIEEAMGLPEGTLGWKSDGRGSGRWNDGRWDVEPIPWTSRQLPQTRRDCPPFGPDGIRRCPYYTCRHHLGLGYEGKVTSAPVAKRDPATSTDHLCSLDHAEGRPRVEIDEMNGYHYTLEEIASVMGLSRQAVWHTERSAIKKLRKLIPEETNLLEYLNAE